MDSFQAAEVGAEYHGSPKLFEVRLCRTQNEKMHKHTHTHTYIYINMYIYIYYIHIYARTMFREGRHLQELFKHRAFGRFSLLVYFYLNNASKYVRTNGRTYMAFPI